MNPFTTVHLAKAFVPALLLGSLLAIPGIASDEMPDPLNPARMERVYTEFKTMYDLEKDTPKYVEDMNSACAEIKGMEFPKNRQELSEVDEICDKHGLEAGVAWLKRHSKDEKTDWKKIQLSDNELMMSREDRIGGCRLMMVSWMVSERYWGAKCNGLLNKK